jgi:integrase
MFSHMASVWKNPKNSRFYVCEYVGADGKRWVRSTRQLNRKDAQRIADDWENLARDARLLEATRQQAEKVVNRTLEIAGLETLKRISIEDAFKLWMQENSKDWSQATITKYNKAASSFLDYLSANRCKEQVRTITKNEVKLWHENEIEQGKGRTTAGTYLNILRSAFTWMVNEDYLSENPSTKFTTRGASTHETREPFTDEEARAILYVCNQDWRGAALFSSWHSIRLGDVARLTWGNVDLERGLIRYLPAKTRNRDQDPRMLVMSQDVLRWLKNQQQGSPTDPLFPTLCNRVSGGHQGLSNEFARIMARAGIEIPLGREKHGKGRRFRKKSFHSFKHLSHTRMLEAEIGPEQRRLMGGHSLNSVAHLKYLHLRPESQAEALSKIPSLMDAMPEASIEVTPSLKRKARRKKVSA